MGVGRARTECHRRDSGPTRPWSPASTGSAGRGSRGPRDRPARGRSRKRATDVSDRRRPSNLHACRSVVVQASTDCPCVSSLSVPRQRGMDRQANGRTMRRGRCRGGRVRGKQPVRLVHGVGVHATINIHGWIGPGRAIRVRVSAHPN